MHINGDINRSMRLKSKYMFKIYNKGKGVMIIGNSVRMSLLGNKRKIVDIYYKILFK